MKKILLLPAVLLLAAAPSGNAGLLADFAGKLLSRKDPTAAFALAAPDMIQHNPAAKDGRANAIALVTPLFSGAAARFTPLHLLADGDLIFLHYHGQLGPGAGADVAELFRVAHGQLAEHWDAFMPDAMPAAAPEAGVISGDENRALIEDFAHRLYGRRDVDGAFAHDVSPGLIQHDAGASGRGGAIRTLKPMFADAAEHYTIAHILAAGPYGVIHVRAVNTKTDTDAAVFDILRVDHGKIAEIWPVIQVVPAKRINPRPPA